MFQAHHVSFPQQGIPSPEAIPQRRHRPLCCRIELPLAVQPQAVCRQPFLDQLPQPPQLPLVPPEQGNVFLLLASRPFHRLHGLWKCTKPCPDGLSAPRGAEDVRAPARVFALPGVEVGSQSIKGRGSRCSRSSWTRWCSSRRTARGSRSGYSYRRSTDTGWKH